VSKTGSIWVGTANWMDHTGFYPRGTRPADRLAYYARHLPLVEVNASFYRRIVPEVYARWAATTPAGFSFVVKAHRAVCQRPRDPSVAPAYIAAQRQAVAPLREAGKFRGYLVQIGFNARPSESNYAYLEVLRDGFGDDRVAVEFRHPSWWEGDARAQTVAELGRLNLALVVPDEPRAAEIGLLPPVEDLTDPTMAYYRFAGRDSAGEISARERRALRSAHTYTPDEIAELAGLVAARHRPGVESFVIFYNKQGNNRVAAAETMLIELARRGLPVGGGAST
jgi:uncharacterized protein YecE (DUF72 family)